MFVLHIKSRTREEEEDEEEEEEEEEEEWRLRGPILCNFHDAEASPHGSINYT